MLFRANARKNVMRQPKRNRFEFLNDAVMFIFTFTILMTLMILLVAGCNRLFRAEPAHEIHFRPEARK